MEPVLDQTDPSAAGSCSHLTAPSTSVRGAVDCDGAAGLLILRASPGEDACNRPTPHVTVHYLLSGSPGSCVVALDRRGDSLGIIAPSDLPDWAADEIEQAAVDAADLVDSLGWKALEHVNRVRLRDAGRAGVAS